MVYVCASLYVPYFCASLVEDIVVFAYFHIAHLGAMNINTIVEIVEHISDRTGQLGLNLQDPIR